MSIEALNWSFPYPSQRMPVFAGNVVATSQPLAAQAGLNVLRKGGNAVDAALAAAITLTVVEPTSNGVGGDCFAQVWDGTALHGFNGSGRSPQMWSLKHFAGRKRMPELGWDAVTVPGVVDGWISLSRRFGKLPFADLFEDAVRYARDGFIVSPITAHRWREAAQRHGSQKVFCDYFLINKRPPGVGEVFRHLGLDKTLLAIAETEGEAFYRGELAEKIASHSRLTGGLLSLEDLAGHHGQWVEPLTIDCFGTTLYELPPNGQGINALIALGILHRLGIGNYPIDSVESIHLQIEAMKLAFASALPHLADPDWMRLDPRELLNSSLLDDYAGRIRPDRAIEVKLQVPNDGGTVYLTAADAGGMMVSYIQSNYRGFGSGIVVPGTGISLHNRGAGFILDEKHPNCVSGGKRPYHTIIPGFLMKDGRPLMSFGVMGAHMQAQGHVQMMIRIIACGQNPQAAVDAPRWYLTEDSLVALEPGFDPALRHRLSLLGHQIVENMPMSLFGGAQVIYRLEDGFCAASDPRKDGQAVGY